MSTIALNHVSRVSVVETLTGPYVSPSDATVTTDQLGENISLTANTTVPVTKQSQDKVTMSSGTGSINLAAMPGKTAEETVVMTGLKVQSMKLRNLSTNANSITVAKGASNGYGLNAAGTSWTVTLGPGQSILFYGDDSAPDVASGARVIDVTGTGAQVLEFAIVAG